MTIEVGKSSGGGGLPINSQLAMNYSDSLYVAKDGTEWLKTGFVEDDLSVYPDAFSGWVFSGVQFAATEVGDAYCICSDGDKIYSALDSSPRNLQTYDFNGNLLSGTPELIQHIATTVVGMCWDNINFWIVEASTQRIVRRFTSAWGDDSFNFPVSEVTTPTDIACSDTYIWILGNDKTVHKYLKSDGSYLGIDFTLDAEQVVRGLTYDNDGFFWFSDDIGNSAVYKKLVQTDNVGINTGLTIDLETLSTGVVMALDFSSTGGLLVIDSDENVTGFINAVGSAVAATDSDSSLPIYIRVK